MFEVIGFVVCLEYCLDVENLEAIVFILGQFKSGMYQQVSDDV